MKPNPHRRDAMVVMAATLAACTNLTPQKSAGSLLSTTYDQRMTDAVIRLDWLLMEALGSRIDRLRGQRLSPYFVARAEALLNFGMEEYQENDETGITDWALNAALADVVALESKDDMVYRLSLPALSAAGLQRIDLWKLALQAKTNPSNLACAGEQIARLEVALVEYGHEQFEADKGLNEHDHAKPYVPLVTALADELIRAIDSCQPVASKSGAGLPAPAGPATGPFNPVNALDSGSELPSRLLFTILFAFDEFAESGVTVGGRADLDRFAQNLSRHNGRWRKLLITGHADRLGLSSYNLPLSLKRAQMVAQYLMQRHGLAPERLETHGLGATRPVAYCTGPVTEALRACLQPNRRVEIEVLL